MGRPSKPILTVIGHRTNSEKKIRNDAEKAMLTGTRMKMSADVKNNAIAEKEFKRLKKLFTSINKDDDLYGNIINTHCLIVSEIEELKKTRERFEKTLDEYEERLLDEEMTYIDRIKIKMNLQGQILDCDKALMAKRKMLIDISKENIMTVQSALRSIPKKPEENKKSGMAAFMERRVKSGG
jgi:hypothetical protein